MVNIVFELIIPLSRIQNMAPNYSKNFISSKAPSSQRGMTLFHQGHEYKNRTSLLSMFLPGTTSCSSTCLVGLQAFTYHQSSTPMPHRFIPVDSNLFYWMYRSIVMSFISSIRQGPSRFFSRHASDRTLFFCDPGPAIFKNLSSIRINYLYRYIFSD